MIHLNALGCHDLLPQLAQTPSQDEDPEIFEEAERNVTRLRTFQQIVRVGI